MSGTHDLAGMSGPSIAGLARSLEAALFALSPVGLHLLDTRLRLVRANTAGRLIHDFPVDRMLGRTLAEVLEACNVTGPEAVERAVRTVLETGRPLPDLHVRARSRTHPPLQVTLSAACFRLQDADGTVVGLAVALSDITARARAEAGLHLLNRAVTGVGTTLDVFRTAEEFCEVAVPELADTVAVDVLDPVLRGEASAPDAVLASAPLRRAGFRSVADPDRQGVPIVGEIGTYPFGTPYRKALADLAPVLLDDLGTQGDWLDPARRRDARLLAVGVHSMMVVPMRARGVVLGLACFYRWRNPTPFDRTDLALAEQLTAAAALCLDNARLYSRERSVARILQHQLHHAPTLADAAVETAHAYLPAGAGGGWFDVVPLSGARVALAVGDTSDPIVNAAGAMGELRAAVAALSDLDLPPDELLERLHDLAGRPVPGPADRGAGPRQNWPASCLYTIYDPTTRVCTMASAGHPPPVLLHPDGEVEILGLTPGPLLGHGNAHYTAVDHTLPEGSTLLLYNTALLGAAPGAHPPDIPLDRLRAVTTAPHATLQDTCDAVVDALAPEQPLQDAVLLLARTRVLDATHTVAWTLPNTPQAAAEARRYTTAQLADWGLDDLADETRLIVSELVTNSVRYARGPIELRLIRDRALISEITDDSGTAPRLRRADDTDEGGRGLFITAHLTDRWGVRPRGRGKTIWAEQALPGPPEPETEAGPEPPVPAAPPA
ncbi:SpoIIE family protein phosphatase [Kitasatospora sp. NBC_01539]|uniref:SpoIIE family protein phosphatase n=1 Tax=Kitasatospora sp. NBC_01539 TaxID=2903577 RepID=UPI0038602134